MKWQPMNRYGHGVCSSPRAAGFPRTRWLTASRPARAVAIYDERFCRMWEFYLAAVELEFLHGSHMVFQLLLSTKRDVVPIMRDFTVDSERAAWAKIAGATSRTAPLDPCLVQGWKRSSVVSVLGSHFDAKRSSRTPWT